ncbi:phage head closure protein [Brevibacillus borstelensis]
MMQKLTASDLNRRITIQKKEMVLDPEGTPVEETWVDIATLWAARNPLSARDFFAAAAVNAEKAVKYRIRYRRGILADMRLVDKHDGTTYEIKGVLDDYHGDRTETHIMVEVLEGG